MSAEEIKEQHSDFIHLIKLNDRNFLGIIISAILITSTIVWQGSKLFTKLESATVDISALKVQNQLFIAQIVELQQNQKILQKQVDDIKIRDDKFYLNLKK